MRLLVLAEGLRPAGAEAGRLCWHLGLWYVLLAEGRSVLLRRWGLRWALELLVRLGVRKGMQRLRWSVLALAERNQEVLLLGCCL